jgi:amphi-Trp domain-containing protein
MADDGGEEHVSEEKGDQAKLVGKQTKKARKRARKEAKRERKRARREEKSAVAHRARMDRTQAAALLDEVAAGVKAGKVDVTHDDQQLTVEPSETVDMRVRARQTWKTQELTIRVSWARAAATEDAAEVEVNAT